MNDFDRDNLEFFKHAPQEEFDAWCDQATNEEISYAFNLIRIARRELIEQELALLDDVDNTDQAKNILKRFTLGK
jgi:hypothetical protein